MAAQEGVNNDARVYMPQQTHDQIHSKHSKRILQKEAEYSNTIGHVVYRLGSDLLLLARYTSKIIITPQITASGYTQ